VLGCVAVYAAAGSKELTAPVGALGGLACFVLAVGLAGRWGPLVQLALSFTVVQYAVFLLMHDDVDVWAPLVAAALLAVGELAYTSIEPPTRRTWPFSLGLVVAAAGVASLLLGAAGGGSGGVRDLVLGVAAAATALAVVARLAATATRQRAP
jgi:hypothetical protein